MRAAQGDADRVGAGRRVGAGTGPDEEVRRLGDVVAEGTQAPGPDVGATRGVAEDTPRSCRRPVLLTPLSQRKHRRPQGQSAVGQDVLVPAAGRTAHQQTGRDHGVQPLGQDGPRDVEVGLQVPEASYAVEAVAYQEQGPALANDLQRAGERAVLPHIALAQRHLAGLAHDGSVTELTDALGQVITGTGLERRVLRASGS